MSQFFEKSFYPISFYYLGMFTKQDEHYMCLPNLNMKSIFVDYFKSERVRCFISSGHEGDQ
jgi:hypothetical protein